MAHPYAHVRAEHHDRAHKLIERTGHKLARGGAAHPDAKQDEALIRKAIAEHEAADHPGKPRTKLKFKAGGSVEGDGARHHLGKRARGGHTGKGKGAKHVTNVIVAPQGGGMRPPMPMPMPPRAAPARPAAPPAPPPRPAAPPPGAGGMPPGGAPMGMRPPGAMKRGGHVQHRARGGRTQKVEEAGVPSESLMQANKGGHVRRREVGGSAGVPSNPTQMTPQQVQQIAQMRRQQQAAAAQRAGQAGARPGMQPPMSGAQAARAANPSMPQQKSGGEVKVREHTRRARGGHVPHMEAGSGGGDGRIEKANEYGSGRGFTPKEKPLHATR